MTNLWSHQSRMVDFALSRPGSLLAASVGTGKTASALALAIEDRARRILVACPLSVCGSWERQAREHFGDEFLVARCDRGTSAKRADTARKALVHAVAQPVIVIVNHESLWRSAFAALASATPWDLVVVDESHRARADRGRFSTFLGTLHASRRVALSGTPMGTPLDIWAQLRFVEPSILGPSFVRFKFRYARTEPRELNECARCRRYRYQHACAACGAKPPRPEESKAACLTAPGAPTREHRFVAGACAWRARVVPEVVGYQRLDELEAALSRVMLRVRAADVLDLPPMVDEERTCRLEPAAARAYAALAHDLAAELERGELSASNGLARTLRLRQICSGTVGVETADGARVAERVSTAKADLLADTLADLPADARVVVSAFFVPALDAIRAAAEAGGRRYAEVSGRRKDGVDDGGRWRDGVDLVGVQVTSGGVGIDLSAASVHIKYDPLWSSVEDEQMNGRLHRPGQAGTVTNIHLLVENSIDVAMRKALREKLYLVEEVLANVARGGRGEE